MDYSIKARFSYYSLGPNRLKALDKYRDKLLSGLPSIINEFYQHVTANEVSKSLFDGRSLSRLQDAQISHWNKLFTEGFTEEANDRSVQIGIIHERIGINPFLYIGGYSYVMNRFTDFLLTNISNREDCSTVTRAVTSLLMMDMEVSITSYSNASNLTRANQFADDQLNQNINLSIATNEVSIGNAKMLTSLENVKGQTQSIAAAIEELSAGVATISTNSDEVAAGAENVMMEANQGKEIIGETALNMQNISGAVDRSSGTINTLAKTSQEISGMVGSIEKIASQTNLLALNATIEAARAGDAGKGFAVVANEVKNLANQTSTATDSITNLISTLTEELEKVVRSMNDVSAEVSNGEVSMQTASHSIDAIVASAEQTAGRVNEIAGVLAEQQQVSEEVSANISMISNIAADNVKAIDLSLNATEEVVAIMTDQIASLAEYDIPNKSVRIAKSDHIIWVKKLADMMVGRSSLNPKELASHLNCRLGKWYYGDDANQYKGLSTYKELEAPHKIVHDCGIEAVRMYNDNDHDGAIEMVGKVEVASKEVVRLLDLLISELS